MKSRSRWLIPAICLIFMGVIDAQNWTGVDPQTIGRLGKRDIAPQVYMTYNMDYQAMKNRLWGAPYEYAQSPNTSGTIITVGLADGSADLFRMVQYDMMEAPLAAQYSEIKTFVGVSISNPYRTIRADWTVNGFRAVIRDPNGLTYIDPFQRNDLAHRVVYRKHDILRTDDWTCGVAEESFDTGEIHPRAFGDCLFRTYRLAVATTGEYSNYFNAFSSSESAIVLAQVVTAVNRVNDVYEADFTTRLILIGNTNAVFYYSPGSDPYTNNNGSTMLGQNQTTLDAVIGTANYDIGHVFSTGGGGVAYLGCVCNSMLKAGGVTGSSAPVGDAFYIDYVAHEMGHQFGGSHTFNGTAGSCNGNRSASSAYEPGSGSTIMAYAGICGAQDLQPNSDAYMHARSILQITNFLSGNGAACDNFISLGNDGPAAQNVPNYTIPISTPFFLTAVATDDDNDPLTYCWEQYDLETTSTEPPTSIDTDGPMFRSFSPTTSPIRYFPRLQDLTQNTTTSWEVLPSVSRTMTFRMTVRDYHNIAGCTDHTDMIITTTSTAGPFTVTSQNAATTWLEGESQTITWNVANTTSSPVNCPNVDLRLSYDGGFTYSVTLLANESNDGSATILVPAGTTTTARVMVKASNNVFFDINNANITINPGLPNFTIALNPASISECNDGSVQTTVEVGQFMGFNNPVTLSILNLPPGATASFVPQIVIPGSTSTLTISNLSGLFGTYIPTVRGSSTTGNKDVLFNITLLSPPAVGPTLVSPINNALDAEMMPLLDWQPLSGSINYNYEVSLDNTFTLIAVSGTVTGDQHQVTIPLIVGQQYFWRVRANNSCGTGEWSSVFSFTVASCSSLMSTNVPVVISASGTPTVTSTLTIGVDMVVNDLNVINLTGSHSWVDDLKFSLIAPDGTERLFWNQPCGNHDNFNIHFDDEAANNSWPCPPTDMLTYKPDNTLSFFDGKNAQGTWTLKIQDVANQDGGSLSSWGLKVCGTLACQLIVNQTTGSGIGSLPEAIDCASTGDTIRLSVLLSGQTINIGAAPIVINKNIVILAEGTDINITGTGSRVFEIANGVQVGFIGMKITAGTSMTGAAISNSGNVLLEDVIIEKNIGVSGATLIQNTSGGQLQVVGNCFIHQ